MAIADQIRRFWKMEKHLELKEKFDQLMKQDMDVSEHEQEWFELLNDMHEYLKDKTIPRSNYENL